MQNVLTLLSVGGGSKDPPALYAIGLPFEMKFHQLKLVDFFMSVEIAQKNSDPPFSSQNPFLTITRNNTEKGKAEKD